MATYRVVSYWIYLYMFLIYDLRFTIVCAYVICHIICDIHCFNLVQPKETRYVTIFRHNNRELLPNYPLWAYMCEQKLHFRDCIRMVQKRFFIISFQYSVTNDSKICGIPNFVLLCVQRDDKTSINNVCVSHVSCCKFKSVTLNCGAK